MEATNDSALLRQFVEQQSGEAFAGLVARHVNLVYSVAMRRVGDPHQAEEITQAVFIVLAKKAAGLRQGAALSSWLFHTTRLTANNFVRTESRRHRREQEAHLQSMLNEPGPDVWPKIAPLLDSAVAALAEKDRDAIVLRFYEGLNLREVGRALGATEEAAEKRVSRAVDKLQQYFMRRGIDSTAAIIAESITANSVLPAPVALAQAVAALAMAKGAAGGSALLAQSTLAAMKTKTLATAAAAAALLLGGGTFFVVQAKARARVAAEERIPVQLPNDGFKANTDGRFMIDTDPGARRTPESEPAGHIKSLVAPVLGGSADYLASLGTTNRGLWASRDDLYWVKDGSALLGKRIRISGWIKAQDVQNWAGVKMLIGNKERRIFADDEQTGRPIHGTADWQEVEFITEVPKEPCLIYIAPTLYGTGEIWTDDFQIDIVPSSTGVNDDRLWHVWSPNPMDYSQSTDDSELHEGHPTLCLAYTGTGPAPHGSWMWWGVCHRDVKKYQGHTVRMTVWTKCENISGNVRPNLRPKGPNLKLIAQDWERDEHILRGSTDWAENIITCRVPRETQCLDTGFAFHGSGKVWIDMDSLKYEIEN